MRENRELISLSVTLLLVGDISKDLGRLNIRVFSEQLQVVVCALVSFFSDYFVFVCGYLP